MHRKQAIKTQTKLNFYWTVISKKGKNFLSIQPLSAGRLPTSQENHTSIQVTEFVAPQAARVKGRVPSLSWQHDSEQTAELPTATLNEAWSELEATTGSILEPEVNRETSADKVISGRQIPEQFITGLS